MEKLSSILPSNARIKSVDLEDAHPIRPGTPVLGRPVGTTALQRDRANISPQAKEAAFNETLAKKNPRDTESAQRIKSVTEQFFMNRIGPKAESDFTPTLTEQVAESQIESIRVPEYMTAKQPYSSAGTSAEQQSNSGQFVDKNA